MELKSGEGTVVVADRDRCCNDGCNRNSGWGSGWGAVGGALLLRHQEWSTGNQVPYRKHG